jgi:Ser/Thr protein kinase RdoA (MazF antagonist)
MRLRPPSIASVEAYGQCFTDAGYWRPYVEAVCSRHGLSPIATVRAGLPGTFPTFIVNERHVVKLFGDLFDGAASFRAERAMYDLLAAEPAIPAPAPIASGTLFAAAKGWPWPYLVLEALPGDSLGQVAGQVSFEDKLGICRFLGPIVRQLHTLMPTPGSALALTWETFERFLAELRAGCVARHRAWGTLPARLIDELDAALPPLADLIDPAQPPSVLHGDLNDDHLLGSFVGECWQPRGIIDFGDALVGDRVHELVALHLGLFRGDKRLLRAFLDAYGFDAALQRAFVCRAMALTLLYRFDVLSGVRPILAAMEHEGSLADLATLLWDVERPGLPATDG